MREFFLMGGNGAYVWSAYGITLVVLIWNIWSAGARLNRQLREAAIGSADGEPVRRATVSQIEEDRS